MKNFKKLFAMLLLVTIMFDGTSVAYAGTKAPSTSSYVNLANGDYTTDDTTFIYKVYTNVCFTGVTKMKVDVSSFDLIDDKGMQNTTSFYCYLYNTSSGTTTKYTLNSSGTSFYYTNMSASTKYYVYFTKTDDTKEYAFTATFSNGN